MDRREILSALKTQQKALRSELKDVEAAIAKFGGVEVKAKKKGRGPGKKRQALSLGVLTGVEKVKEETPAPAPAAAVDPELEAKRKRAEELKAKMAGGKKEKGGGPKGPLARKSRRPPEAAS